MSSDDSAGRQAAAPRRAARGRPNRTQDPIPYVHTYTRLPETAVEDSHHYIYNTTTFRTGYAEMDKLVDDECEHGRLPGDRTPPCGCWGVPAPEAPAATSGPNAGQSRKRSGSNPGKGTGEASET